MAKDGKKASILLVVVIFFSILIFAGAFFAGYFYKDKVAGFLMPGRDASQEINVPDKLGPSGTEELPEDFPESFPVYKNASLENSWTAQGNTTKGISVVWMTDDSVADVNKFYQESLESNSWQIVSEYEAEGSNTISFEKEGTSGFIGITRGEEGKTLISVTMGIE